MEIGGLDPREGRAGGETFPPWRRKGTIRRKVPSLEKTEAQVLVMTGKGVGGAPKVSLIQKGCSTNEKREILQAEWEGIELETGRRRRQGRGSCKIAERELSPVEKATLGK